LSKKLYVGNLSYDTTEEQVRDMLTEYGTIESVAMINDRDSGNFRGFCFVEMEDSAANGAINGLNGKDMDGRELKVNEAKPREERGGGFGGNRGGAFGGNRGGSGNRGGNRGDKFPHSGGRR
jgi:RNA recognition motif-containing protein